jgi:hypothetical protein
MNKNNAKEFLPLVQALAEGKTIQVFHPTFKDWENAENPEFCYSPDHYRIKPEPIELEGITQATSRCHNDDSGMIRLTVNWPSAPPKIGTKFRLIEII